MSRQEAEHKFIDGSVKELWSASFPIMLSWLSAFGMTFIDRLFLARYSLGSLAAATAAGTLFWAFCYGMQSLTEVGQTFVAHYNGARRYSRIGPTIWQMVWVSLVSVLFFWPIAANPQWCFSGGTEWLAKQQYFRWLMAFGPIYGLWGALNSFYVGRGRPGLIVYATIFGNLVNVVLDPLFIFGWEGHWLPMGAKGAAIATGIGMVSQSLVLAIPLFKRDHRQEFALGQYQFDRELLLRCLRVGGPNSLVVTLELAAWAFFYAVMDMSGERYILVAGACQSIMLPFFFFGLGLEKGALAIAGNFLGARLPQKVFAILRSGLILIGGFQALFAAFFLFAPHLLIDLFLGSSHGPELLALRPVLAQGLALICFYVFFENVRWLLGGMLVAAGDTLFLMVAGTLTVWLGMALPTYLVIRVFEGDVLHGLAIWAVYALVAAGINLTRFLKGSWRHQSLIEQEA